MPKIFEWRDTAKFWIRPKISVAYNRGFSSNVLSQLIAVIEARGDEIERQGHDFFST